jgi:transcriptional regulator with XRE-family HTH domain
MNESRQNWRAIAKTLDNTCMDLDEFLALYPDISREQLAKLAGCEIATVNNWFASGSTHRSPTDKHKMRLAIAHWLKNEPGVFRDLRDIMDEL